MNVLVDTHLLLWTSGQSARLSKSAKKILQDPASILWFSAASIWEVAIKRGIGRDDFQVEPLALRRGLLANGWNETLVSSVHAVATLSLPPLHKDPFDRMLLAQAQVEGFTLLTSDKAVAQYPGSIRRV